MRYSRLFLRTLRAAPRDAERPGLQYLFRGGFVARTGAGNLVWLPGGLFVLNRLTGLVEGRLAGVGAQRMVVGAVEQTMGDEGCGVPFASAAAYAPAWFWTRDVEAAAAQIVQSYRQLPACLYSLDTERRDVHPVSAGWFDRLPGCVLKGIHLAADETVAAEGLAQVTSIFAEMGELCGLDAGWVPAGDDETGQVNLRRLVLPGPAGDRLLFSCPDCGLAQDAGFARAHRTPAAAEAPRAARRVSTPDCKTILDLCRFLNVAPARTAKAIFLMVETRDHAWRFTIVVVRGDTELNPDKLGRRLEAAQVRLATEEEIRRAGAEPGFGSPVGLSGVTVVVDNLVAQTPNLVAGANAEGYHLLDVNYGRDFVGDIVADITLASGDDTCPNCGRSLLSSRVVEMGWVEGPTLKTGDGDTVQFSGEGGGTQPAFTVAFGLNLHRLLAAAAEKHLDERGLAWPVCLAPFDVYLMTIGQPGSQVASEAERLETELAGDGISVLFDDRDERAGVKFNDADLMGMPVRVVVGDRGLRDNVVEVKAGRDADAVKVNLTEVRSYISSVLGRRAVAGNGSPRKI